MIKVFCCFAAVFATLGWLLPHVLHRIGFWMASFYLLMAGLSAILALVRSFRST